MGIGKSSLLARGRLMMEGFASDRRAKSVVAVANKDVKTVDQAARLLLERFVDFDEVQRKARLKIGSILELESGDVLRFFAEGRHMAALNRVLDDEYLRRVLSADEMLVLAIDEADKAPVPLAQLIRTVVTHTQHEGIKNVRFVVAGVSPFFQEMVNEDPGIARFVYQTISMEPMSRFDAADLVQTKLAKVVVDAERKGLRLRVDQTLIHRIVALSGGHPHLIQLLGSHLIEHEEDDPDGVLDAHDMTNALRRIAYEDRARVYTATLHMLELHGFLDDLRTLLGATQQGFPTRIGRKGAVLEVGQVSLQWLVDHNILSVLDDHYYGLVDEFNRVRLLLDAADSPREGERLERELIEAASASFSSVEDRLIDRIDHPEDYSDEDL